LVALRHAVASQLVGHYHARHIFQTLQRAPEERLGGHTKPCTSWRWLNSRAQGWVSSPVIPRQRVILSAFVGHSLEYDEQGDHEERRGVSKSEVLDIVPLSQS
jgi:hypothetical protein